MMPSLGKFSLMLFMVSALAVTIALLTLPDARPLILKQETGLGMAVAPLLAGLSGSSQPLPQSSPPLPRLVSVEGRRTFANEALALGVRLSGASGSEFALVTGLVSGTRLSTGGPFNENGWRLPARELASVLAYAPKDFSGVMNATIDLRLPNDMLVDSRSIRLEWIPKPLGGQAPAQRAKGAIAPRSVDAAAVASLLKRGEDYLKSGDIASARLVLRRAAGMGSAQAALVLGASYDPVVLNELGVVGFAPDLEQARIWYKRAAESGLDEASKRLDRLAKLAY